MEPELVYYLKVSARVLWATAHLFVLKIACQPGGARLFSGIQ